MNARQKTVRAAGMSIIVKAGIKQVSKRETFRAQGKWKITEKKMVRVWIIERNINHILCKKYE